MKKQKLVRLGMILLSLTLLCSGTEAWAETSYPSLQTNVTGWEVVSGNWSDTGNGVLGANADAGNCFLMSDIRTEAKDSFLFSARLSWSGVAAGLVFGVQDSQSPDRHWCAFNVDVTAERSLARLFFVSNGALLGSNDRILSDGFDQTEEHTFLIEVTDGEYVDFYLDEEWIGEFALDRFDVPYSGGYLGIYTAAGSATFQDIQYQAGPFETTAPSEPAEATATARPAVPTATADGKPSSTPIPQGPAENNNGLLGLALALGVIVIAAVVLLVIRYKKKS